MLEIMRRVCLLGCVLCGIWWATEPVPALLRVGPIDFAKEQKRDRRRSFGFDPGAALPMDQYIPEKTKDRLVRVQGQGWGALYENIVATSEGTTTDPQWTRRLERGYSPEYVFFRTDESPLAAAVQGLDRDHSFTYLAIDGNQGTRYLGITYSTARDRIHYAPGWMAYPRRQYSLWLALIGLLIYVFLPWPRRPPEAVVCPRGRAIVLPDIMGVLLASLFFGLPFFIISQNSSVPGVLNFTDGWGYLTLVFWLMALGGVAMLVTAAWYAGYQIHLLPDRLRKVTLAGEEECLYAQMKRVGPIAWELPGWFRKLAFLAMLLNPRAGAPARNLLGEQNTGIGIDCADGRTLKIWMSALDGGERIVGALRRAGVRFSSAMDQTTTGE